MEEDGDDEEGNKVDDGNNEEGDDAMARGRIQKGGCYHESDGDGNLRHGREGQRTCHRQPFDDVEGEEEEDSSFLCGEEKPRFPPTIISMRGPSLKTLPFVGWAVGPAVGWDVGSCEAIATIWG